MILKKKQIRYFLLVIMNNLRILFLKAFYSPRLNPELCFRRQRMRLHLIKQRMKMVAKYGCRWRLRVGENEMVEFLQVERDVHTRVFNRVSTPNDPSSATRPAGRHDCNSDAMAGFAAAHG